MNPQVKKPGGSNPTPRTREYTHGIDVFKRFLRSKRLKKDILLPPSTVESKFRNIKTLARSINLWDSEAVKHYLDFSDLSGGRKHIVAFIHEETFIFPILARAY